MAAYESSLATLFVDISTRGLQTSVAGLGLIHSAVNAPRLALSGIKTGLANLRASLEDVTSSAKKLAALGGSFIGFFGHAAARDTIEGDKLANSFEYLSRSVGQMFAPYVVGLANKLMTLASIFNGLTDAQKDSIAKWVLIGTGIATVVAILPTVIAGLSAVVGVIGFFLSPIMLAIGGFAALTTAIGMFFSSATDGGSNMADAMNEANMGWLESLMNGVQRVGIGLARFFNWVMERAAAVSDTIAYLMARAGQNMMLLPKGTADIVKQEPIKPFQIDVDGLKNVFERGKQAVRNFVQQPDFQKILKLFTGGWKADIPPHFHMKMDVQFESMQGTFERLQKALASPKDAVGEAQLGELKGIREGLQKGFAGVVDGIKGIVPVVQ